MNRHVDFLLVGGGPACATAAVTLRAEGAEGTITMVAAEQALPYRRPALSKQFLSGVRTRDRLDIFSDVYYREQEIEILLGTRALALDPEARVVRTDRAGSLHYDKLLIATGSSPRRLEVPGGSLPGVHYLRTIADSEAVKGAAKNALRAAIVGGSFIGMELASSLTQMGVAVTLIVTCDALFDVLKAPVVSEFFLQYYQQHGVEIIFGDGVKEVQGEHDVERILTHSGRIVPCDLAMICIGVTPETEFLHGSGIAIDDGILVDEYLQTNLPHVFAAGDVANFLVPVFGIRRRIEHWDNAIKQGRTAAKNMLGLRQVYHDVSYFFSNIFDLTFNFLGCTEDIDELIERGSLERKSFTLFYLKDSVLRASFSLGRPAQETQTLESLISNGVKIGAFKDRLHDPGFRLEEIPVRTVFILQGGGALGAFECGVVKALEEVEVYPDVIAGVSIGAINGAIIAGNPRHASAALEAFWEDITLDMPLIPDETLRQMFVFWNTAFFGSPRFFRPRWFMPILSLSDLPINWTSLYDPSPIKDLLQKYVDFKRLKESPVRLLINAVDVEIAEIKTFDSYLDDLTPDHILASGSLPPAFPWTAVDGKYYWDGGVMSNSPLHQVVERCGGTGKRVFIIDLYPPKNTLPKNLLGTIGRRNEIHYSERIRKDLRNRELIRDFRGLIEETLSCVNEATAAEIRQSPHYIQLMGDMTPTKITRIVREVAGSEMMPKDYDFSRRSIEEHKKAGYRMARKALSR